MHDGRDDLGTRDLPRLFAGRQRLGAEVEVLVGQALGQVGLFGVVDLEKIDACGYVLPISPRCPR
jgi:hypothetical protein